MPMAGIHSSANRPFGRLLLRLHHRLLLAAARRGRGDDHGVAGGAAAAADTLRRVGCLKKGGSQQSVAMTEWDQLQAADSPVESKAPSCSATSKFAWPEKHARCLE
jgi:hypothetical protein